MTTTDRPASPATERDAHHVPITRARARQLEAAEATEIRAAETTPAYVAMRVERTARIFDRAVWGAVALGLAYTMQNVQHFGAAGAGPRSLAWWFAWLLDPIVSIVLVAILIAEQTITRHGATIDRAARRAKWLALAATYAMNTWAVWAALSPSGIVRHSVPPLAVFWTVNAAPGLRIKLMAIAGRIDPVVIPEPAAAATEQATEVATEPAKPTRPKGTVRPRQSERPPATGPDVSDLLTAAKSIADDLGDRFNRDRLLDELRASGHRVGGSRRKAIYDAMLAYRAGRQLHVVGGDA